MINRLIILLYLFFCPTNFAAFLTDTLVKTEPAKITTTAELSSRNIAPCVQSDDITVSAHNAVPVVVGFAWTFGIEAVKFIGASIGVAAVSLFGITIGKKSKLHNKTKCWDFSAEANEFKQLNDAQAPGKPTENDGYIPPKRWDGKKVKNPNGSGYGWPDHKGNVWVPTGPKAHGGPHWDVQFPDGEYDNIMPGGHSRRTRNKEANK